MRFSQKSFDPTRSFVRREHSITNISGKFVGHWRQRAYAHHRQLNGRFRQTVFSEILWIGLGSAQDDNEKLTNRYLAMTSQELTLPDKDYYAAITV